MRFLIKINFCSNKNLNFPSDTESNMIEYICKFYQEMALEEGFVVESNKRREEILKIIQSSSKPLKGSYIAELFGVSRQVIVQDIAILRAGGAEIIATPNGYITPPSFNSRKCRRIIACRHSTEDTEDELMTIVDLGGTVVDVIVEHEIYGEFKGELMISSPADVRNFIKKVKKQGAKLLSSLKGGIHLHTIEAPTPEILDKIEEALDSKGYLLK